MGDKGKRVWVMEGRDGGEEYIRIFECRDDGGGDRNRVEG